MIEISKELFQIVSVATVFVFTAQLFLAVFTLVSLRVAAKERSALNKEMFGMLKKIEGLTANKRDQVLAEFDRILEDLSLRLPPAVAAKSSEVIFEMESKILSRLAELEPDLDQDQESRRKMESLIKNMEHLEQLMVGSTADTVKQLMMESRKSLYEEASLQERKVA